MGVMPDAFLPMLMGWSVLWIVGSAIGLWTTTHAPAKRAFWFMTAMWCAVNIAIACVALIDPPESVAAFRRVLLLNGGLDVGYLAVGALLLSRPKPVLKGFGVAILVQGAFLLVFDLIWWAILRGDAAG